LENRNISETLEKRYIKNTEYKHGIKIKNKKSQRKRFLYVFLTPAHGFLHP
jgi:hypothetical protein